MGYKGDIFQMSIKISFSGLLKVILLVLGLFLIYHFALKLLGGSLGKEDLIIAMLSAVIIHQFYLTKKLAYLEGEFSQFKRTLNSLAADFKEHLNKHY